MKFAAIYLTKAPDALAEALVKWFKPNFFVWIGKSRVG
jgi:hypothetical protein